MSQSLPVAKVYPDPHQPRTSFDPAELEELAASIRENGLQQPIKVRPDGKGRFQIIYGERRWRAHKMLKAKTIDCIITEGMEELSIFLAQVIENVQRSQMTPLEEARAYQKVVDALDGNVIEAARRLGLKHPNRVTARTCLLNLRPEHQKLLANGNLKPSEAFEIAQLQPRNQDRLFEAIRKGQCPSATALRTAAVVLREEEAQAQMFPTGRETTPQERRTIANLEARIDAACRVLSEGFIEGELVAASRIDPNRAALYADKLALIARHIASMENQLRAAVIRNGKD